MTSNNQVQVAEYSVAELLKTKHYVIPLYQRGYEWEETQIERLVEDFYLVFRKSISKYRENIEAAPCYYLGTLVVMQRGRELEVVDGQQRLTTLSLLYRGVNLISDCPISFENRPLAAQFLKLFFTMVAPLEEHWRLEGFQKLSNAVVSLSRALKQRELEMGTSDFAVFKMFLRDRVKLFQVILPENTDVADYFEIMNNRGRQLEAHEILRAKLYERIPANDRVKFSADWDICKGEDPERTGVTLANWVQSINNGETCVEGRTVIDMNGKRALLTFPELLLIALRCHCDDPTISLNDQNLLETFRQNLLERNDDEGIQMFMRTLITVRAEFDCNIIRSKVVDGSVKWSLVDNRPLECDDEEEDEEGEEILLQSLLEVSGTSHWIASFLYMRHQKQLLGENEDNVKLLKAVIKHTPVFECIRKLVGADAVPNELHYNQLVTPLVLNVLDYLFWKDGKNKGDKKDAKFVFRYRNSIEHFYPQEDKDVPKDELWQDCINVSKDVMLHGIGNLYLVTSNQNSWLSNDSPKQKIAKWQRAAERSRFEREVTPKQRRMYYDENGKPREKWAITDCWQHALYCWKLLCEFFNESPNGDIAERPQLAEDTTTPEGGTSNLKSETVEEILRGLRKSPESGGAPAQA